MATAAKGSQSGTGRIRPGAVLHEYESKRNFALTPEPAAMARPRDRSVAAEALRFVVQKHDARRLHYDFRLELEGALKSWAVPKGPSLDPTVKRLAVHVEDHPLDYAGFEGHIPQGEYGGGDVIVWDRGIWQADDADALAAYRSGKLKFHLLGEKLSGGWALIRTRQRGSGDKEQWLLIQEYDDAAREEAAYDIVAARPESVLSHAQLPPKVRRAKAAKAAARELARLDSAIAAPLPAQLAPELATLVAKPPAGDWRYEIKFDGYRMLARIDGATIRLFTRNGLDWTDKLKPLAEALAALRVTSAWLDGEIVVFDNALGIPDFQALQNAFEGGRTGDIVFYLFDIPYYDGLDLRKTPLEQRRDLLKTLLRRADPDRLRYSEDFPGQQDDILRHACELQLEGVIGKRSGSIYVSRRSTDWIKLKCTRRQEFVICGHTAAQGTRSGFGALLLGVHDEAGALHYAGRVGTGFSEASLRALHARLRPLVRSTPPFPDAPKGRDALGVTWVEPVLVCEVELSTWTREGLVRQASFHGLREDKPVQRILREQGRVAGQGAITPDANAEPRQRSARIEVAGIAISNPERVIDAESGTTKLALAEFYRDLAPYLLPHLAGRPLSILRAPTGVAGEQFFQRHAEKLAVPGVRMLDPMPGDSEALMEVDNLKALIGVVQMGTIEFHTWNSDIAHIDRPDRLVLDLDPDPVLPWTRLIEATRLVLTLLDELGLKAFLKTSGGKGMHVVVPLARRHDWGLVKAFSKAVAHHLALTLPQHFADRMGPKNRVGKIFVDYLRNQKGASTVAAYSVRARPGLPVSVPIASDELDSVGGAAAWNVRNLAKRLEGLAGDPWAGYANAQGITREMRTRLGLE